MGCFLSSDGKDLTPALEKPGWSCRDFLHGEHTYGDFSSQFVLADGKKLIWFPVKNEFQFFDLETDPTELNDIAGEADYGSHLQLLIESLQNREEGFVKDGKLNPEALPKLLLEHAKP